jgi:hypothetical protein
MVRAESEGLQFAIFHKKDGDRKWVRAHLLSHPSQRRHARAGRRRRGDGKLVYLYYAISCYSDLFFYPLLLSGKIISLPLSIN